MVIILIFFVFMPFLSLAQRRSVVGSSDVPTLSAEAQLSAVCPVSHAPVLDRQGEGGNGGDLCPLSSSLGRVDPPKVIPYDLVRTAADVCDAIDELPVVIPALMVDSGIDAGWQMVDSSLFIFMPFR